MKITATWLESRKHPRNRPSSRQEVAVDGHKGLYAWVYPSGEVVFVFRYTMPGGGARKKLRLGKWGDSGISLARAFTQHQQAQRELEAGLDPAEEEKKRQQAARATREEHAGADTVAQLVEQFVHRKLRAERWDDKTRTWMRDPKARTRPRKRPEVAQELLKSNLVDAKLDGEVIGNLKARDLTRRQLVRLLDAIVDRPAPVTANRVHALLVQMFNWAAARDIVPASPVAGIERPGGAESPRNRVLTAEEICTFWTKLDSAKLAEPTKLALKLLLVTAQRRGELTFATWSHFDLDAKIWTIPPELLKSSHSRREAPQAHVVPLSPLALELLGMLHSLTGESRYVLPARADQRKNISYSERVLSRAVRDNHKHFGIPHFTPHDLRRTAASFMTKIGIPRLHVEKVLNHATGDIAEVYDRHDYLPEKRAALDRWAAQLTEILKNPRRDMASTDSSTA